MKRLNPFLRWALGINTIALAGYLVWLSETDVALWRGSEGLLYVWPLLIFFWVYIQIYRSGKDPTTGD
ncbi:MAG: hypothetical protein U1E27_04740 [Kiritimatiellia bacterium]|nr:hypothetical protein [Kiritimatiellia bacterium]